MFSGGDIDLKDLTSWTVNTFCAAVPTPDPVPKQYERMILRVQGKTGRTAAEKKADKAAYDKCNTEVTALMKESADKLTGLVSGNALAWNNFHKGVTILNGQTYFSAIQKSGFNTKDWRWHLRMVAEMDRIRTSAKDVAFLTPEGDEDGTVKEYMDKLVAQSAEVANAGAGFEISSFGYQTPASITGAVTGLGGERSEAAELMVSLFYMAVQKAGADADRSGFREDLGARVAELFTDPINHMKGAGEALLALIPEETYDDKKAPGDYDYPTAVAVRKDIAAKKKDGVKGEELALFIEQQVRTGSKDLTDEATSAVQKKEKDANPVAMVSAQAASRLYVDRIIAGPDGKPLVEFRQVPDEAYEGVGDGKLTDRHQGRISSLFADAANMSEAGAHASLKDLEGGALPATLHDLHQQVAEKLSDALGEATKGAASKSKLNETLGELVVTKVEVEGGKKKEDEEEEGEGDEGELKVTSVVLGTEKEGAIPRWVARIADATDEPILQAAIARLIGQAKVKMPKDASKERVIGSIAEEVAKIAREPNGHTRVTRARVTAVAPEGKVTLDVDRGKILANSRTIKRLARIVDGTEAAVSFKTEDIQLAAERQIEEGGGKIGDVEKFAENIVLSLTEFAQKDPVGVGGKVAYIQPNLSGLKADGTGVTFALKEPGGALKVLDYNDWPTKGSTGETVAELTFGGVFGEDPVEDDPLTNNDGILAALFLRHTLTVKLIGPFSIAVQGGYFSLINPPQVTPAGSQESPNSFGDTGAEIHRGNEGNLQFILSGELFDKWTGTANAKFGLLGKKPGELGFGYDADTTMIMSAPWINGSRGGAYPRLELELKAPNGSWLKRTKIKAGAEINTAKADIGYDGNAENPNGSFGDGRFTFEGTEFGFWVAPKVGIVDGRAVLGAMVAYGVGSGDATFPDGTISKPNAYDKGILHVSAGAEIYPYEAPGDAGKTEFVRVGAQAGLTDFKNRNETHPKADDITQFDFGLAVNWGIDEDVQLYSRFAYRNTIGELEFQTGAAALRAAGLDTPVRRRSGGDATNPGAPTQRLGHRAMEFIVGALLYQHLRLQAGIVESAGRQEGTDSQLAGTLQATALY